MYKVLSVAFRYTAVSFNTSSGSPYHMLSACVLELQWVYSETFDERPLWQETNLWQATTLTWLYISIHMYLQLSDKITSCSSVAGLSSHVSLYKHSHVCIYGQRCALQTDIGNRFCQVQVTGIPYVGHEGAMFHNSIYEARQFKSCSDPHDDICN